MQVTQVPNPLFIIFTAAVVLSILIQAGVFLGLYFIARKAANKAEALANELSGKALPILAQTRTVLEDLSPKLKTVTANLVEVSNTLRDQTKHVNSTVGEVVDKTRSQAARVDEMVSAVLDGVTHASATIQHGVGKPIRKVGGVLEGIRVGVETLFSKRSSSETRATTARTAAATGAVSGSPVPTEPFFTESVSLKPEPESTFRTTAYRTAPVGEEPISSATTSVSDL